MKVLWIGGELVVWRRSSVDMIGDCKDYLPCEHCLIFVTRNELWRHKKKCSLKKEGEDNANSVIHSELLLFSNRSDGVSEGTSEQLKRLVLPRMIKDAISLIVNTDHLILLYGSFMLVSAGIKNANGISQRMHILSRVLLLLRKETKNTEGTLIEFLKPRYFDITVINVRRSLRALH